MFEQLIIDQIQSYWSRGSDDPVPPPTVGVLRTVMETVFFSGLKREEDRAVQVSLMLMDPETRSGSGFTAHGMLIRLDKPLPLSVDNLVKLALAFDSNTTTLCVNEDPDAGGRLTIWGASFISHRGISRFDSLMRVVEPPDVLAVSTRKTGHLSIFRGNDVLAHFSAGRLSRPTPTPFTSSLMGWSLLKNVKNQPEFQRHSTAYWRAYRDLIDRILVEINKRGHGGAIIWVPETRLAEAQPWIIGKNPLGESPEGAPLLDRLCQLEMDRQARCPEQELAGAVQWARGLERELLDVKRRLVELAEFLAQLTAVDGAVIITDRLKALSFGSVLVAPVWRADVHMGTDKEEDSAQTVDLRRYGTRHGSAVNFVGKVNEAVAFVISQDGPITGITSKSGGERLYWWPDCLSRLWSL
ncbi:MAG: hypothetical protein H7831_15230 [Magnetococcus sp. WYHC-3]